jgi:hypothetical protein
LYLPTKTDGGDAPNMDVSPDDFGTTDSIDLNFSRIGQYGLPQRPLPLHFMQRLGVNDFSVSAKDTISGVWLVFVQPA